METDIELLRLEDFVDKLLGKFNQLKSDYADLQQTLRERDAECVELKETIQSMTEERNEVGSRVVSLIERIEEWELEQGETERPSSSTDNPLFGMDNSDHHTL